MTLMSRALYKSLFDGNTILLETSEECGRYRYVYFGGDMICSFLTDDSNYKYRSNMENNLTPYIIVMGEENIYFLTPHFKYNKKEKNNKSELLKTHENSVDPFDYLVSNCGKKSFI